MSKISLHLILSLLKILFSFLLPAFAPLSFKNSITSFSPDDTARSRGVFPSLLLALTSPPDSSRTSTNSFHPLLEA